MSWLIEDSMVSSISCVDGQMSFRKTSLPSGPVPSGVGLEVEVHGAGERVGDDQRRGGQVVHLDVGGDATLEVAVTREHRGDREVVVVDRLRDASGSGPVLPMQVVQP